MRPLVTCSLTLQLIRAQNQEKEVKTNSKISDFSNFQIFKFSQNYFLQKFTSTLQMARNKPFLYIVSLTILFLAAYPFRYEPYRPGGHNIYFFETDTVHIANDFIHMTIQIDLTNFQQACQQFKGATTTFATGALPFQINPIQNLQDSVQNSCNVLELLDTHQQSVVPQAFRQPRALPLLPLLPFAKGAIYSLTGLFNIYTIYRFLKDIFGTESTKNLRKQYLVLKNHDTYLEKLNHDIGHVTTAIRAFEEMMTREGSIEQKYRHLLQLTIAAQSIQGHSNFIQLLWNSLNMGKLPVNIIPPNKLIDLYRKLKYQAEQLNAKLIFDQPLDILQLPTTFSLNKRQITILVHCPLVQQHMTMYKLVPIPTKSAEDFHIMIHDSQKDLLLVSADNAYHTTLTHEELTKRCHTFQQTFVCENLGVLNTDIETSCLGALFTNNPDKADVLCDKTHVAHPWMVHQLSSNNFVIFSQDPTQIMHICANGTRVAEKLHGVKIFQIQETCYVTAFGFQLRPSSTTTLTLTVQHEMYFDDLGKLRNIDTDRLSEVRDSLDHLSLPKRNHIGMDVLMDEAEDSAHRDFTQILTYIAFGSISILSIILTLAFIYLCKRFYNIYQAIANPPPPPPEEQEMQIMQ